MSRTIPLAQYIFSRLRQLGCHSIHGVPGDFTMLALDSLPAAKVGWVGNANELCAGYAADGYARAAAMARKSQGSVPRVGAVFTTYGVGELSVINAIAGAYAESSPVVHLVGTPKRPAWRGNPIIHHSLGDGRMRVYADMAKQVTCAQADLSCDNVLEAVERYDATLVQCVLQSKPVYINLAADLSEKQVPSELLDRPLRLDTRQDQTMDAKENQVVEKIFNRIKTAQNPLIIADGLSYPWNFVNEANEIVMLTRIPAMCFSAGKGIIDEHHLSWIGPLTAPTVYSQATDLALLFGPLLSNTNTGAWTAVPDPNISISFNLNNVDIGGKVFPVRGKNILRRLVERLKAETITFSRSIVKPERTSPSHFRRSFSSQVGQDALWQRISSWIHANDTVILANGTPLIGFRSTRIPSPTHVIASGIWLSIGSMLPCAQGVALAKRDNNIPGRTILFEGDGSFQETCQSLSDIIRQKLDITIIMCNNAGYTYQRLLHGRMKDYNARPVWSYVDAPAFFGAIDKDGYHIMTRRVSSWGELEKVLEDEAFADGRGLKMIEVIMDPDDVPSSSRAGLKRASESMRTG